MLKGQLSWTPWCLVISSQSWPHVWPAMNSVRRSSPTATFSPSAGESNRLISRTRTETASQEPHTSQKAPPLSEALLPCLSNFPLSTEVTQESAHGHQIMMNGFLNITEEYYIHCPLMSGKKDVVPSLGLNQCSALFQHCSNLFFCLIAMP